MNCNNYLNNDVYSTKQTFQQLFLRPPEIWVA